MKAATWWSSSRLTKPLVQVVPLYIKKKEIEERGSIPPDGAN